MLNQSVLILGGGFVGLFTALYLKQQGYEGDISLIDRETRFIFRPLLYDLLSREVPVDMVWPRYDELLLPKGITHLTGEITDINLTSRQVTLDSDLSYGYRYLVLGLGNTTGYFGVSGADQHSFSFRTGDDAFRLGKHLRLCLQQAKQETTTKDKFLTVVIVGAGPSGVELASTLGDLLPQWYENLRGDSENLRIIVLQKGEQILSTASDKLRDTAEDALRDRGVPTELIVNAEVIAVTSNGVEYRQGDQVHHIPSATVVWTAGNVVNPLIKSLPIAEEHRNRQGCLKVEPTLQLPEYPEIFAGGDCAIDDENPQPATAQVAYQQGEAIAKNICALSQGKELQPATVSLRGTLLKLGMNIGVAEMFDKFEVTGHPAHLIRQAVYLNLLPTPARNLKQDAKWLTDEIFAQVLQA